MQLNEIYELDIIDNDNLGNGIAKLNNFVVFVFGVLKGEKVKAKITSINKRYANAKLIEIISSSDKRIEPSCKYYNICGGCNFLHTSYDNEIDIKLNYLKRLFNRNIEYLNNKVISNYRNKVTLHVHKGKLGLLESKTHDLVQIDECMLLDPLINLKIRELNKLDLNNVKEIVIRNINNQIMINIICDKLSNEIKNIKCDSLYINDNYYNGNEYLIDEINNFKFSIYPLSFYQVNKEVMSLIYNKAKEYIGKSNNLLDLYCGTGTIGIWMSDSFKKVKGIEINESSIKNANINKKINNISNIDFICSDASLVKGNFDSIIVDPPRIGLSNDVVKYLNNSKTNKIVYISCNPNTLKRDIDNLTNYDLTNISCASMFPRTKHIECVCLLERR